MITDYKTANDAKIEELQIFLDKHNLRLKDLKYCEYEEKYFNHEVKTQEVFQTQPTYSNFSDSWEMTEEVIEWIPKKYNTAFTLLNKEFEVVNTSTNVKYCVEWQYELE